MSSEYTHRFCAAECLERRDNQLGTASIVRCFLAIECAGSWPSSVDNLLDAETFGVAAVAHLREFMKWCPVGVRVLLIKRRATTKTKKIYLVLPDLGKGTEFLIGDYGDLPRLDLKAAYEEPGELKDLLFVCTHGKRDKCCAKFGFPVFKKLSARFRDVQGTEVWQCTHVGGDRFAANVIWMPYGLGFAHVHVNTDRFTDCVAAQRISLAHLRGWSALPSAAQYLEGLLRSRHALSRPREITLLHYAEEKDQVQNTVAKIAMRLEVSSPRQYLGTVRISRDEETGRVLASCNKGGHTFRRNFELISLEELEGSAMPMA